MQSSLDDLLDEIDSALTTAPKKTCEPAQPQAKSDIDDLLSELSDLGGNPSQPAAIRNAVPIAPPPVAVSQSKRAEKCYFLCISAPSTPKGVSFSAMDPKVCSSLRCTGCDCTVFCFPDSIWMDDCEYYFFRNNYQRPAMLQQVMPT